MVPSAVVDTGSCLPLRLPSHSLSLLRLVPEKLLGKSLRKPIVVQEAFRGVRGFIPSQNLPICCPTWLDLACAFAAGDGVGVGGSDYTVSYRMPSRKIEFLHNSFVVISHNVSPVQECRIAMHVQVVWCVERGVAKTY